MKIYVGNLPYTVTEVELKDAFSEFGEVINANIISDKHSGKSMGYGFVEMQDSNASDAITALHESPLQGRNIKVNKANDGGSRTRRKKLFSGVSQ
ncbi:MAG TPA: RNA-binding protein [Gammaproteobacteria bacterium]|nr:RNA-binding protein [Gammaproteobacteria bacterium]